MIERSVDVLPPPSQIVPMRQARLKAPADHPGACCQTLTLADARPGSECFQCGGRGSNFLALNQAEPSGWLLAQERGKRE